MKILDRYIAGTVAGSTLMVLLALLALLTFFTFLDQLGDIGKGNYDVSGALWYSALTMPRHIYRVFPAATLLGCLLGLGALATGHELVAVRSAGVSRVRMVLSVLRVAALLGLLVFALGEWVTPRSERLAQDLRASAITEGLAARTESGYWARDGQTYINIRDILPDSSLGEIYIYEFGPDDRLQSTTHARRAVYQRGFWMLQGVRRTLVDPGGVVVIHQQQQEWVSLLDPELLAVVVVKPEHLSARGLRRYAGYLRANGQDADRYELAFWNKLVMPFNLIVMTLLALPFVFGPLRTAGVGQRVLAGTLVGLVFSLVSRGFGHGGLVYGISPMISAAAPAMLFLVLGALAARRVR